MEKDVRVSEDTSAGVVSSPLRTRAFNNKSTTLLLDTETCDLTKGTMLRVLEFFRHHTPEHQPSTEILAALSAIPRTVAQIARGEAEPKFYICPLATGTGKTVTLVHAVRLLREWDHYRGLGLILCANRLDQIEAMVKEFRKKDPNLIFPIIHAFFGDSPNANLDAEIAVFREQCYQKHEMSVNSIMGPRASGFLPGKDGEAGDVGFIVDTAGCSQAKNKPPEARSSSPTGS